MSRNINGIPLVEAEPDFICFLCGKVEETRPYSPNGEEICFECGMKDRETTERMMGIKLFGDASDDPAVSEVAADRKAERDQALELIREYRGTSIRNLRYCHEKADALLKEKL